MSKDVNRQWRLAARPQGMVKVSDFKLREEAVPTPGDGQILVRNLYLAFEPAMRGWIEDRPSYMPPVGIGEVMRAAAAGQVVKSNNPGFEPGQYVQGMFGWQDYAIADAAAPIPPGTPITWSLGVLGITGLTAYFGLLDVGEPKKGDTVVVSGAAGATGSVAGQIAKIHGCRVVGIAGGPEKCRWLTDEVAFDAAIDYRSENVEQRLGELCPDGIHVYFDNVGGDILDAALLHIAEGARVVLCGAIANYNLDETPPGPKNYFNLVLRRARMEGFIVIDYASRFGEGVKQLTEWVRSGQLKHQEDVQEGFENAPTTFLRLFQSKNTGKQLLKIADAPL